MLTKSKKLKDSFPLKKTRISVIVLFCVWAVCDITTEILEGLNLLDFEATDTGQVLNYFPFFSPFFSSPLPSLRFGVTALGVVILLSSLPLCLCLCPSVLFRSHMA